MNRLIVFSSEQTEKNLFRIACAERFAHLRDVLKVRPGRVLKTAVVGRGLCRGRIVHMGRTEATVAVEEPFEKPVRRPIRLFAALSRPATVRKLLEHGTAMGVGSFGFFEAEKSQKSYGDSKLFEGDNIRKYLMRGLAQSGRLFEVPEVSLLRQPLADICRSAESSIPREGRLLLSPKAPTPVAAPLPEGGFSLAVGPEGGWTEGEVDGLVALGFAPTVVSHHILRVETAVFAALSQIEFLAIMGG